MKGRVTRRAALGAAGALSLPTFAKVPGDATNTWPVGVGPDTAPAFAASLELAAPVARGELLQGVAITGGKVTGTRLQGSVSGGVVHTTVDAARSLLTVVLQFAVRTPRGSVVQVQDRGLVPREAATCCVSQPELLAAGTDAEAPPALFVGRIELGACPAGRLQLIAWEVMD